ncbi:GAF domain-containing sensor histidine kinase [Hyphococcus luteus]|nr:GAF domain-containing protein [Marinicaulis flavus]
MTDAPSNMSDQDHLREMIEVISGELELRPLLTVIVQKACELLRAERGSIGLIEPEEGVVRIEAVYRMPPEELGSIARPGEGLAGRVYAERAPVLLDRYGELTAPPLAGMDEDSVIGMPIMWRGDIIGTFGIGAGPPKRFGDNDIHMLGMFARHAAIAINNARAYEQNKKYAALKERQQLARDLHDNVSQLIFSLSLVAESIGAGYARSAEEGDARVSRLLDIASLAQKEMKALLAELRAPSENENHSLAAYARANGLVKALERHRALTAGENVAIHIEVEDEGLTEAETEALLRIAQEATANAVRHGAAETVRISLAGNGDGRRFRVEDDGRGLAQIPDESGGSGLGVASMRARAGRIGGAFTLANRPEGGACVEVLLPLA